MWFRRKHNETLNMIEGSQTRNYFFEKIAMQVYLNRDVPWMSTEKKRHQLNSVQFKIKCDI